MRQKSSRQSVADQLDRVQLELDQLKELLTDFDPSQPPDNVFPEWIRGMLEARRRREEIFGAGIFADPSWDILLELYAVHLEGARATITDLCKVAAVPPTTALRWIRNLEGASLVVRTPDSEDKRRIFVALSPPGIAAMERYFCDPRSGGAGI